MKQTQNRIKQISLAIIAAVTLSPLLFSASASAAASAVLYMSPASGSYTKGGSFSVSIRENSYTEPVNAVQANFSYPASSLQYVSISSSSAFGIIAQSSGGSGSVKIGRGAMPAVSGDQLIATVQFKVLAGSGTATLAFTSGSSVVSASTNTDIMTSSPGASYTLKTATTSTGGGSTGGGSTGGSTTTTKKTTASTPPPAKDTTPPVIQSVAVTNLTTRSATISWTTSEPATSEVDYGLVTGYGLAAVDTHRVTAHKITLSSQLVIPATTYHFIVRSKDAAGNRASSADSTFTTKGASLVVTVLSTKNGQPIKGASVSYNGQMVTTDSSGQATLADLPVGKVIIVVAVGKQQSAETVVIDDAALTAAQKVAFKVAPSSTNSTWLVVVPLAVVALIGLSFIGYRLGKGGRSSGQTQYGPTPPVSTGSGGGPNPQAPDQSAVFSAPQPNLPPSSTVIRPGNSSQGPNNLGR